MSNISDLILQQVASAAGGVNIPSNIKQQALSGLSESVLSSLTQTIAKPGGLDLVKNLLTGKANAASSPVTALAGNIFSSTILKKLGLDANLGGSLTSLIPTIVSGLSGVIKDRDGDGDVDLNDILLSLQGGNGGGLGGGLLGAATSILGGLFKK